MTFNIAAFLLSILLFSIDIYLVFSIWFKGKRNTYLKLFFALGIVNSLWALFNGVNVLLSQELYKQIYPYVMIMACIVPHVMLRYTLFFTESKFAQSRMVAWILTILPAIDVILLMTNPWHHEFIAGYEGIRPQGGRLFIVHALLSYVPIIIMLTTLFRYIIKNIKKTPALIYIGLGLFLPIISNVLYTFEVYNWEFDITPFMFLLTFIIFAVYSVKFRLFDVSTVAFSSLFVSSTDSILVMDPSGRLADTNPTFKTVFSELRVEPDITPMSDIVDYLQSITSKQEQPELYERMMLASEEIHNAEVTLTLNGKLRQYLISKDNIIERGDYAGCTVTLTDKSDFHRIEQMNEEINEKNNRLVEMKEAAESASMAKSDFLARMSHEIRTPMNAIVGITELAMREPLTPDLHEHMIGIKNAGNNLLSIINDILDFSKIESGKLEIVDTEYYFASIINDIINIIRIRVAEKSLFFAVNLDGIIPSKLIGDETRVRQILINLLSNAVKYTNSGHIAMTVDGEIVDSGSVLLSIEISDSGIGIKPEDMEKLFADFVQVDMASHKGVQGTGLGLAITKSLCIAMGGDISVRSEYGKGSTFTVQLPQKFSEYEKIASVDKPSQNTVLLYEPRDIYAKSIIQSINNLDVEAVLVQDAEQFSEALKSDSYTFVFVPSFLFEEIRPFVGGPLRKSSIVLLTEYGEPAVAEKSIKTIAMPLHSFSIANMLNGISDASGYGGDWSADITFSAPEARVLIVDDLHTNLKVAEGLMAPYNMQIDTCMSGQTAIDMIKANLYDLVFMDHMMPEMDGIEATRRIREIGGEYFSSVPVIALTANAISGVREMFIQNGMNDFLSKPIETTKLNAVLEQWIPREKRTKKYKENNKAVTAPSEFKIEGVDVSSGVFMTGGTMEAYVSTLAVFYKDGLKKVNEIRDCVEKSNIKLYTTYVHSLKSASASIGAVEISELAKALETAGTDNNISFISEKTGEFLQDFEVLLKNIGAALSRNENDREEVQTDENDLELFNAEIAALKKALDAMDVQEAYDIIDRLKLKSWDNKTQSMIDNISENILLFNFDQAADIIDSLL